MFYLKKLLSSEFKSRETPKKLIGISSIVAFFFLAFKAPVDPDLFWHLKTGELIWQYQIIPSVDWYSCTMSDFPWIDHEWLAEILMFKIKDVFGWPGLAIFFALIIAFIFSWLIPRISQNLETKKYPFYTSIILGLLGAITSSLVFGPRPQVIGLLGIALTLYIIRRYQLDNSSKIISWLPLLFLLWANMHACFIIGLGLLIIYLILDKGLRSPAGRHPDADWLKLYKPLPAKSWKKLSWFAALSAATTFINPYGAKIYTEIARTLLDNYAPNVIAEWLSPNFHSVEGIVFGFYLIFLLIIVSLTKKTDLYSFVLLPFLLFLALRSERNIPIFIVFTLPFLIRSLEGFEKVFSEVAQKKALAFFMSALLLFYPPFINETNNIAKTLFSQKELARYGNYPSEEALSFLKNHLSNKEVNALNDYNWGGYLIERAKCEVQDAKLWCEPKVFIDGRMAHWKMPNREILKDYRDIFGLEENAEEIIDKYKIKLIFIRKELIFSRYLAINNKWKKIYEDSAAVIYELR